MSDDWLTDFRWRIIRVSSPLLSEILLGLAKPYTTNAPADLAVIGLIAVNGGPGGSFDFVVWSATFDPAPNDGQRLAHPIPTFDLEVTAL